MVTLHEALEILQVVSLSIGFSTEQTISRHNMLVSYYLVAEGLSGIIYNNKRTRNFLAQLRISGVMSYEYGTVKCLYVICIY